MPDTAIMPAEQHAVDRIGWLRAAVLGANDGIVSTASLIVGVAAAASAKPQVLVAGIAGLVAGALSMAAGEYVSVSSQADTEAADLARERGEHATQPEFELEELTEIYRKRGLDDNLAKQVAAALTAHDALGAHARDPARRVDRFAAVPDAARRDRRKGWRRADCARDDPGDILGRNRNGRDLPDRHAVRDERGLVAEAGHECAPEGLSARHSRSSLCIWSL